MNAGDKARANSGVITSLQITRAAAALAVVACHLSQRLMKRGTIGDEYEAFINALGYTGVASFFIISGFVMVYTTTNEFRSGHSLTFLKRRIIRILPLYYLTTLVYLAIYVPTGGRDDVQLSHILYSFLFIPYFNGQGIIQPVYGLGWSLQFEMAFYSLFAFALLFERWLGNAVIIATITVCIITGMFLGEPTASSPQRYVIVYFFTREVSVYFLIGVIVGVVATRTKLALRIPLPDWTGGAVATLLIFAAAAVPNLWLRGAVITAAIFAASFLKGDGSRASPLSRFGRHLGDVSYSIYLTHSFVASVAAFALTRTGMMGNLAAIAFNLVTFVACILVAHFSWICIEKPIGRFLGESRRDQSDPTTANRLADRCAL